jgi:ribosomal protein S12 methylthiotransferase accessory factor
MTSEIVTLNRSFDLISSEIGILSYISKLPSLNHDPNLVAFGIWPCNTAAYSSETFGGRSSGCAPKWENALLTTLGETIERYCPSIYNLDEAIQASFQELGKRAVHPSEFALFHPKQYQHYAEQGYNFIPFTPDLKLHWFPCIDLVNGSETWCPGAFIYLPWTIEENWININTSTGLAAHSDFNKSIMLGLYECIERDAFVMSWAHEIFREKIVIDAPIRTYIRETFPGDYEWHFFDINYDLETPTVFGICFGTSDFGSFVAVGTSARGTYGEALKKVVNEIGQAVSYFRYLLGERKDWVPDDNYNNLQDFEEHSIFYLKRPDMLHAFDPWRKATASKVIELHEPNPYPDTKSELKRLLSVFRQKGYNVLAKDLTLPDVRTCGYYATAVFVPQLLQMNGAYEFYFLGGHRLYEVPRALGLSDRDYDQLNPHPHPFP